MCSGRSHFVVSCETSCAYDPPHAPHHAPYRSTALGGHTMRMRSSFRLLALTAVAFGIVAAGTNLDTTDTDFNHHGRDRLTGPSQSGPIALSPDDRFLWVVNPDVNTVSLLE